MGSESTLRVPLDRYTDPPFAQSSQPVSEVRIGRPLLKLLTTPTIEPTAPTIEPTAAVDLNNRPPEEWFRRIVLAILEVTHNKRATSQLRGIVAPPVLRQLDLRRQVSTKHLATSVLGLRISQLSPQTLELSCSFQAGARVYPMALRMELQAEHWIVTACDIGPH